MPLSARAGCQVLDGEVISHARRSFVVLHEFGASSFGYRSIDSHISVADVNGVGGCRYEYLSWTDVALGVSGRRATNVSLVLHFPDPPSQVSSLQPRNGFFLHVSLEILSTDEAPDGDIISTGHSIRSFWLTDAA